MFTGSSDTNGCVHVLGVKISAGVSPEVNLWNPLHAGDKACNRGIHHFFQNQDVHHHKSKTGASVGLQKIDVPQKLLKQKNKMKERCEYWTRIFVLLSSIVPEVYIGSFY